MVAKLVVLIKEFFEENNPYIKEQIANIDKATSGTRKIEIKLFAICQFIICNN